MLMIMTVGPEMKDVYTCDDDVDDDDNIGDKDHYKETRTTKLCNE